jgi:hypothetical protein
MVVNKLVGTFRAAAAKRLDESANVTAGGMDLSVSQTPESKD